MVDNGGFGGADVGERPRTLFDLVVMDGSAIAGGVEEAAEDGVRLGDGVFVVEKSGSHYMHVYVYVFVYCLYVHVNMRILGKGN